MIIIMKAIMYNVAVSIAAILCFVIPAMLCTLTQSHTVQRMHRIEFEQCVGDEYSDSKCDSCYDAVLAHHHYIFNNTLGYEEQE